VTILSLGIQLLGPFDDFPTALSISLAIKREGMKRRAVCVVDLIFVSAVVEVD
jgi:hypothetical protein